MIPPSSSGVSRRLLSSPRPGLASLRAPTMPSLPIGYTVISRLPDPDYQALLAFIQLSGERSRSEEGRPRCSRWRARSAEEGRPQARRLSWRTRTDARQTPLPGARQRSTPAGPRSASGAAALHHAQRATNVVRLYLTFWTGLAGILTNRHFFSAAKSALAS
jgi:hypothetical protein